MCPKKRSTKSLREFSQSIMSFIWLCSSIRVHTEPEAVLLYCFSYWIIVAVPPHRKSSYEAPWLRPTHIITETAFSFVRKEGGLTMGWPSFVACWIHSFVEAKCSGGGSSSSSGANMSQQMPYWLLAATLTTIRWLNSNHLWTCLNIHYITPCYR